MSNAIQKISNHINESAKNSISEQLGAKIVNVSKGKKFTAKICQDYKVYLLNGELIVKQKGMIYIIIKNKGEFDISKSIFNENDIDGCVYCNSECQLLLLPRVKLKKSSVYTKQVKFNENILVSHQNIKDDNSSEGVINVSFYNLDRSYVDTVELTPEDNSYLTKQREKISKTKIHNSISNLAKSVIKQATKGETAIKKVSEVITKKVPSAVDGIADMIDKSLKSAPSILEENQFSTIGYWKALEVALPKKSGIYYVSDGKNVKKTYFNKNRLFFHKAENMEITFWSSKKISLKK